MLSLGGLSLLIGWTLGVASFSEAWYAGLLYLGFFWGIGFLLLVHASHVVRVHALGVEERSLLNRRALRYSEIASLTYGEDDGEVYLRCSSDRGWSISYSRSAGAAEAELEQIRDEISQRVAHRLLKRVRSGVQLRWGEVLLGRDAMVVGNRAVAYSEGLHLETHGGGCRVFVAGEKAPVFELASDSENFHPRLAVLGALAGDAGAALRARRGGR
jgi:hypothetical protein